VRRPRLAALLVSAVLAATFVPAVSAAASYRVIVNPQVKGTQIPRATLSSIFLKRGLKWGDGSPVTPVDQSLRSKVRQSFAADVLQQPLVEVQIYWQRAMAKGMTPPPVKPSDEEVVAFVAATPGAIGYVSSELPLPGSVREVAVVP
jgi:ABC-type phosphate transport system substrate-binding protein